ncbi:Adenylate cyclase [hydrothermal vent metagenome]|uniref:Adenylate cyclase n=1 Tax=hydrothermal vent metagenome TaxID=652676 RepID=A0A1W1ELG6_9ZZZZ
MNDKELYSKLAIFGKKLLERPALEDGMHLIANYAKEITTASRCSIFIHNKEKKTLWTAFADSIDTIKIPDDKGIVGKTLKNKIEIIVNNPYGDPDFFTTVDAKSGFTTKNIASIPIFDSTKKVIGVLQFLNKDGGFDEKDIRFIKFFAHYVSSYLELASVYGEI